jgi:cytochrome c-type biogenesis protein
MEAKILPVFLAGLVSFVTPCVLPLVPGYLSVVSGTQPGVSGRRVVTSALPFVAGFSLVFVILGAAVGALGATVSSTSSQIAGIVLVVFGLAFMGLLPFPWLDRLANPELVQGARRSGSRFLLGGAFAVCAAPCVGPFLAAALALAGDDGTVGQGSLLLLVYSLGLALPFVAVGAGFTWATSVSRWLRERYRLLQVVGGGFLVAFGLLLFFGRDWWLRVAVNRMLETFGVGI